MRQKTEVSHSSSAAVNVLSPCLHVHTVQIPISVAQLLDLPGRRIILEIANIDWPASQISSLSYLCTRRKGPAGRIEGRRAVDRVPEDQDICPLLRKQEDTDGMHHLSAYLSRPPLLMLSGAFGRTVVKTRNQSLRTGSQDCTAWHDRKSLSITRILLAILFQYQEPAFSLSKSS